MAAMIIAEMIKARSTRLVVKFGATFSKCVSSVSVPISPPPSLKDKDLSQ